MYNIEVFKLNTLAAEIKLDRRISAAREILQLVFSAKQVGSQDQALTAKVQVSPFVASSGGTTVVAAVVGQAPVPQQTRASRASTRATARAS